MFGIQVRSATATWRLARPDQLMKIGVFSTPPAWHGSGDDAFGAQATDDALL
jgi:hypothetical protein